MGRPASAECCEGGNKARGGQEVEEGIPLIDPAACAPHGGAHTHTTPHRTAAPIHIPLLLLLLPPANTQRQKNTSSGGTEKQQHGTKHFSLTINPSFFFFFGAANFPGSSGLPRYACALAHTHTRRGGIFPEIR